MLRVSKRFIEAVKLGDRPGYKIAQEAGLHPVQLSKIITGYDKVWPNDRRVLAVAKVIGLDPKECFVSDAPKPRGKTLLTQSQQEEERFEIESKS